MIFVRLFLRRQDDGLSHLQAVTIDIQDDHLVAYKNSDETYSQEGLLNIICEHRPNIYLIESNVLSSKYCQKILDHMDTYGAEYLLIPGYLDRRIQRAKMVDFQ